MTPAVVARQAALVEDLEFLINCCEHPEQIVARLGFKSFNSLEQRLYRMGRNDLAYRARHATEARSLRTGALCTGGRAQTT